ncbi:hypothetical protein SAICODRAFT_26993 [Saitoella complicata NRRL Y-17804]|uniref:BRCT domain-containing protein n=1 Tax=Saitoella complicata (strain BCRC 22490 / CBS 7301 / JCM 7358 / NBRC 10748 / NRRL Y-17804) TaxID=698492 RepID=A0A0E9NHK8_SAICN|nr:uncharacterized protein SAICODRAFT_26993 [Saitoella complicata NRRL Y-17804]ODQ51242.1 hypothetical protein SAICODRAFT_26993 [Saitoella complicata NRRL Y-17804]GAO49308.1 hypothetical protein G7K_3459-t1 [Saitoella complicata NRRL Y-17804]
MEAPRVTPRTSARITRSRTRAADVGAPAPDPVLSTFCPVKRSEPSTPRRTRATKENAPEDEILVPLSTSRSRMPMSTAAGRVPLRKAATPSVNTHTVRTSTSSTTRRSPGASSSTRRSPTSTSKPRRKSLGKPVSVSVSLPSARRPLAPVSSTPAAERTVLGDVCVEYQVPLNDISSSSEGEDEEEIPQPPPRTRSLTIIAGRRSPMEVVGARPPTPPTITRDKLGKKREAEGEDELWRPVVPRESLGSSGTEGGTPSRSGSGLAPLSFSFSRLHVKEANPRKREQETSNPDSPRKDRERRKSAAIVRKSPTPETEDSFDDILSSPCKRSSSSSARKSMSKASVRDEEEYSPRKLKPASTSSASSAPSPRKARGPLHGCVVYVDVRTADGDDASPPFASILERLGARTLKTWTWNPWSETSSPEPGVTHVVFKEGGKRTLDKVREALRLRSEEKEGNGVRCVGLGWVLACEREGRKVEERAYVVEVEGKSKASGTGMGGHRRRKSMEPKALVGLGLVLGSPVKGIAHVGASPGKGAGLGSPGRSTSTSMPSPAKERRREEREAAAVSKAGAGVGLQLTGHPSLPAKPPKADRPQSPTSSASTPSSVSKSSRQEKERSVSSTSTKSPWDERRSKSKEEREKEKARGDKEKKEKQKEQEKERERQEIPKLDFVKPVHLPPPIQRPAANTPPPLPPRSPPSSLSPSHATSDKRKSGTHIKFGDKPLPTPLEAQNLMSARRKSMQFASKMSSPLARKSWVPAGVVGED